MDSYIFFDESGTKNDPISLMGGLKIPKKVYELDEIRNINNKLQESKFKLHWTKYDKRDEELYLEVISSISKCLSLCKFNVIRIKYPSKNISGQKLENMVYSQIPGKVIYGITRFSNCNFVVYIEKATRYEKLGLDNIVKNELNNKALYRGLSYEIKNVVYKNKNEEIGVELTDIILGIIRTVMNNSKSNSVRKKNELIVKLCKNKDFRVFLENILYFECDFSKNLKQIDFRNYLTEFLQEQDEWLKFLLE